MRFDVITLFSELFPPFLTHGVTRRAFEAAQVDVAEILKLVAGEHAKRMYDTGDLDAGILPCGQGIGLVHDIPTIKELFDRIVKEATDIARNLAAN